MKEENKMNNKINFNKPNILFISNEQIDIDAENFKKDNDYSRQKIREKIEPWLTAIFQSEHLSLLIGSGLSIALASRNSMMPEIKSKEEGGAIEGLPAQQPGSMMKRIEFENEDYKEKIKKKAEEEAQNMGRGEANFEDDLRVAIELLKGYEIQDVDKSEQLKKEINENLKKLLNSILKSEVEFLKKINPQKEDKSDSEQKENNQSNEQKENNNNEKQTENGKNYLLLLEKFLLSFSTRTATRDRLNIFNTNYDRFIEFGLDEAGILTLDRFIGKLKPIMRFHRVDLDYHYNPPGIRGEPRYVEGVVRYTKLHGSVDWQFEDGRIIKIPLPFGADKDSDFFDNPYDKVVIYPNSAKAIETSFFPYSELFRDFSTAICRPNSVLVTYGYGFGDSHINRIILDMLTIPSTHLVIISYDLADGRIKNFIEQCNESQLTLLIGKELGNFENLTNFYLPKPAIDRITERQSRILEKRKVSQSNNDDQVIIQKNGENNESEF